MKTGEETDAWGAWEQVHGGGSEQSSCEDRENFWTFKGAEMKSIFNASIQYLTLISIDSQTLLRVAPFCWALLWYESSASYKLAERREAAQ